MSKIAFLGLGQMGTPMAARLLRAGHHVTVWNRTAERTAPLVEQGATAASSPSDAAVGADVAITMLATSEALEEVLFGPDGLASALSPGQLLVAAKDMRLVDEAAQAEGIELVQAHAARSSLERAMERGAIVITVATLVGHLIPLVPFLVMPRTPALVLAIALSAFPPMTARPTPLR
jgi:3-hydroxyisobutyrate dehydrogenase-like beta-hydroxyacid dehydrogenase